MDSNNPSSNRRKIRFTPKDPSKRKTRGTSAPKKDKRDDSDDAEAQQQLLQSYNKLGNFGRRPKVENRAPVQATFIHGTKQSVTTRGSDVPHDGNLKQSRESDFMDLDDSTKQSVSSPSAAGPSVIEESSGDDLVPKTKEYREPWTYAPNYPPTTLPWRRPNSGDPDILNEAEFGEKAMEMKYDENLVNPASKLGFLNPDETSENRLLFFQLPSSLPAIKRSATAKGKEVKNSSGTLGQKGSMAMNMGAKGSSATGTSQKGCSLEELPAGQLGKLLVYKSGAVKLKLGDTLYDVSPGADCSFFQDVVAFNIKEKECCSIGNLDKRAVVTPDVDYILNSVIDLS